MFQLILETENLLLQVDSLSALRNKLYSRVQFDFAGWKRRACGNISYYSVEIVIIAIIDAKR